MKVSLFITCLADTFFPDVGESVVRVLRRLGVDVDFPIEQTCCGQVAFNSGYHEEAARVASSLIEAFERSEYVVAPSGSCAAMCRHYYPILFRDDPDMKARAEAFNHKLYEFSEFLVHVLEKTDLGVEFPARATYHSSCHMMRGLEVREEPLQLLRAVKGLELVDLPYSQDCCGFGGTFAVKMADVSEAMLDEKLAHVGETGADVLIGSDMACLMHMGGRLQRIGSPMKVMHVAQVLDEGGRTGR